MTGIISTWSRRQFVKGAGLLSAAAVAAENLIARNGFAGAGTRNSVYGRLGIRPLINAAGTYTALSACTMPREVAQAMEEASRSHVAIAELHEAVGKRIASLTGAEAALVTAGAANSLSLATAACVAGKDPERIRRIPDTTGMKNEVILQKTHKFGYDHAIRAAGARLVEVETREQLQNAVGDKTAMMFFLNYAEPNGQVKRKEFVEIAKNRGIPTLLDAAADLPPAVRLSEYVRMGFDLVAFSGGKGLRGPQCSGLLLGRKELVEAAYLNGSPHSDSLERGAKVGKEEIVGLWTAVELFVKKDHEAEWREWESRVRDIAKTLEGVRGVKTESFVPQIANESPHLRVSWDERLLPLKNQEAVKRLRDGEPRIEVRPSAGDKPVLEIAVWMLQPGEHRVVARRVRQVLS
ncbi:MAG TPA: aminotransferase class V-fold PLP-dependent enzyme [Acidobacteriota bacterium]|nr:aminotransferase class V-fold PLP-dependent enzyme [Acidobacteriota bacterium]